MIFIKMIHFFNVKYVVTFVPETFNQIIVNESLLLKYHDIK